MAGPLQVGDVVNLAKLAWDVYNLGFTDEHNATKNYTEFGQDVRGLAENLNLLANLVGHAGNSLQSQGAYGAVVRWDPRSLTEIIGDYHSTLQECMELLKSNNQYGLGTNVFRNLEWNVLVQPNADRLRQRIMLHNSKISLFLKPFELDLLTRVRQDIYRVHQDLALRITAVHHDIHRIIGILIPDLEQEMRHRERRQTYLLPVPNDIAEHFRYAALADRPYRVDFELGELSDAFVLNFDNSTRRFSGEIYIPQRTPPLEQYLNLLKCVWLVERIKQNVPEDAAQSDSHWPSYVEQLEDELSVECNRFNGELIEPQVAPEQLNKHMLSIWPEKEPAQLVDVVTRDEIMEKVLEAPLETSTINIERRVKLLRRMGSDGRKYRIMISGSERTVTGKPRQQTEVIDFDLASAVINPHYAMPGSMGREREMILRRDERIARLSFTNLKDVLRFQQALTGFKAWDSYCQYDVLVSFVVAGLDAPVVEKACIQLWIPKPVEGSLVTNSEVTPESRDTPSRSGSVGTATTVPAGVHGGSPDPQRRGRDNSETWSTRGAEPISTISHQGRSSTTFSTTWPRQQSPGPLGTSPTRGNMFTAAVPTPPSSHPRQIPRKPVGSTQAFPNAPPSPRSSGPLSTSPQRSGGLLATSPQRIETLGSNLSVPSMHPAHRTLSMSSNVSNVALSNSNSSGSDSHTRTISTGPNSTGFLHQRPPKPRIVLFTHNEKDDKVSFVSIEIDEETTVNPERCDCRRAGKDGTSCLITSLERRKGSASLEAKRFQTSRSRGDVEWNIARLALKTSHSSSSSPSVSPWPTTGEDNAWPSVKRVSFMFKTSDDRAKFGGTPNKCRCINRTQGELKECLKRGHKGLFGEVQEYHRLQMNAYTRVRYESHQQVVNSPLMGST